MNDDVTFFHGCVDKGKGHGNHHDELEYLITPGDDKMEKSAENVNDEKQHSRNQKDSPYHCAYFRYPLEQVT